MSDTKDIDAAIRRWWQHDLPAIEAKLRKSYFVGAISREAISMFYRGLREAFIAGWHARGRRDDASGQQQPLLPEEEPQ